MNKILLVDDIAETHILVKRALGPVGELVWAQNLAEARQLLRHATFSLVLLDLNLPDGSGIDFFAELRSTLESETPVILLTGSSKVSDKVAGFALGAEDYIVKPFDAVELRARVDAKLRKATARERSAGPLIRGELVIETENQAAYLASGETRHRLELTPLEFRILVALARNAERVLSRTRLVELALGPEAESSDRAIDKHVCRLRKKLGPCGSYLKTAPGTGYLLSPPKPAGKKAA